MPPTARALNYRGHRHLPPPPPSIAARLATLASHSNTAALISETNSFHDSGPGGAFGIVRSCETNPSRALMSPSRSLSAFSSRKPFQLLLDLERPVARQVDALMHRPVPVMVQRDFVLSRFHPEPLEQTVEVVHDARVIAVHIDLGIPWRHFETNRAVGIDVRITIRRKRINDLSLSRDARSDRAGRGHGQHQHEAFG